MLRYSDQPLKQAVSAESSEWLSKLLREIFPKRTIDEDTLKRLSRRLQSQGHWFTNDPGLRNFSTPLYGLYDIRDAIYVPRAIEYLSENMEMSLGIQDSPPAHQHLFFDSATDYPHWESLPEELWVDHILLHLNQLQDVISCCMVSRDWKRRSLDEKLWRALFYRTWNCCVLRGSSNTHWMSIYSFFHHKFRHARSCTVPVASHTMNTTANTSVSPSTISKSSSEVSGVKWEPIFSSAHLCPRYQPVIFNTAILGSQSSIFEFRVSGLCQVGVITSDFFSTIIGYNGVGDDPFSYAFDGERCRLWHNGYVSWGQRWRHGDVVAIGVSVSDSIITLQYFLNGNDLGVGHVIDKKSSFASVNAAHGIVDDSLKQSAALFPAISCFGGHYASVIAINAGPEMSHHYPSHFVPLAATPDWHLFQQQRALTSSDIGEVYLVRQKIPYCELRDGQNVFDDPDDPDYVPPTTPTNQA